MVNVTGSIKLVTNQPANISEVWLRAPQGRINGTGYVAELPGSYEVNNGQVSFELLPGAALMVLVSQSRPVGTVKLIVPDKANATLRECIEAADLADDGTVNALERLAQEVASASVALDDKASFLHRTVQAESISRLEAVQEVPVSPDPTTLYLVLAPIGTVELKESDWSSTYRVKVALEAGQEAPYYNGKVLSESFIGAPNGWHTWGKQELAVPKDGRYKIRTTATPATGWVTISTYDQAAAASGVFNWAFGSGVELVADLKAGDLVYAYATSYGFTGETTITTNISETMDPLTDISANDDPKALPTMRYQLSGTMGTAAEMPSAKAPMVGEFVSGSSNWWVDGGESHGLTPLHSSEPLQWEVTVESSKNVGAVGFYIYDGATKKFRKTEYVRGQTYTSIVALNNSDVLYPLLDTGGTLTGDIQVTVTAKAVI